MSKRPIYGNWEVQAPDGEVIFYDSVKRANWYLDRNLANIVGPNIIRLNFEPAGRRDPSDLYSLSKKSNRCVCCNTSDLDILTRHHIVASEYRKFYPLEFKSRSSHDIIPICREHHNEYETEADKLKEIIAKEFGCDLNNSGQTDIHKALKHSKVLLNDTSMIPKDRLEQITEEFIILSGITTLSEKNLLEFYENNKNHTTTTHGEKIVKQLIKENKLYEFTVRWRQHFIDTMNPKYMPKHWSTDRKLDFK